MEFLSATIATPIGPLTIWALDRALAGVAFEGAEASVARWIAKEHGASIPKEAADPAGWATRFERYFGGDVGAFDGGRLAMGGTEFQRAVWIALIAIPPGTTMSYGELARRVGRAAAVRAVGAANGANPIPIVVPCHRVIAADGSLHGYGGGLDRKRWLLDHEGRQPRAQRPLGFSV